MLFSTGEMNFYAQRLSSLLLVTNVLFAIVAASYGLIIVHC